MDSKKSSKITDIVRLQRLLKKWKNHAKANATKQTATSPKQPANASKQTANATNNTNSSHTKSINKFLKRTLSFTEIAPSSSSSIQNDVVPKGFLAVDCVNGLKGVKRFVIPTEYLGHRAFGVLLREAEEEFGFQQEGVLKIPCEFSVFEKILKVVEGKTACTDEEVTLLHELGFVESHEMLSCSSSTSPDCDQLTHSHPIQMCR